MKRNYISELKSQGLSLREIERQTGINHRRLSEYVTGKKPLKSSSKAYETLRNINRKTSYNQLRQQGMATREADKYRRIVSSPKTYQHKSTRSVKHTRIDKTMYQLKMLAEYSEAKSHEKRIIESFSFAHASKPDTWDISSDFIDEMGELDVQDYDTNMQMVNEAIRDAQSRLGGSNWMLERIIDIEVVSYVIG